MAISSVARKATIREDRSIQEAMQILGQQQAMAGRLALQQKKLQQDAITARNEETARQFKILRETDSPYSPYNEEFDQLHDDVENALPNPNIPFNQKESMLADLTQFSKSTMVVKGAIIKSTDDRVGTEQQRKMRNADEIARAQVAYIQPDGEPIDPTDFDEQKMSEVVDNTLSTYNVPNNVEEFMNQQKDIVATEVSSKNLASGFSRNDIVNKAAKFLVLNDSGTGYKVDDLTGKPIANITGENLEAFESFSQGNKLAIDAYLAQPGNENQTRLDGMKNVLEQNGWLTARETVETKIQPTPKPPTPTGREQQTASARDRIAFFDDDLKKGGKGIASQLRTGRAVESVDVKRTKTGIEYTIKIDENKLKPIISVFGEIEAETGKEPKIITKTIIVQDANQRPGFLELSALFDKTIATKFEVDPILFSEEFDLSRKGTTQTPFPGAFDQGGSPFEIDLNE